MKPLKSLKVGDAIRVRWIDSFSVMGWRDGREPRFESGRIVSQGYVTECDKEFVGITSSIGVNGTIIDPLYIPWVAISGVKKLGKKWDR